MATTATRNRKTGKVEVDGIGNDTGEKKKTRVSHAVPTIGSSVKLSELTFKPTSKTTKYTEIVQAIRGLKLRQGITFHPADGETPESLKTRISALVSRSCAKAAPEGTKYRTRITQDDEVCVFLDAKKKGEDDE